MAAKPLNYAQTTKGHTIYRPVALFSLATLTPAALLFAAALRGGLWAAAALAFMTVLTFALDRLISAAADPADPETEFPAGHALSLTLALLHFPLLAMGVWSLSGGAGIGLADKALLFMALSLFLGQVQNSNAHELIHRSARLPNRLGRWVYITLLFGHHASAHPHIHHRYVATPRDPNTARLGENFYHFARRAWLGSFRAGLRIESERLQKRGLPRLRHPYIQYFAGAWLTLAAAALIGGAGGVLALIALGSYAQMQLLLSDYVQHYGLTRAAKPGGGYVPVGPAHSWNAPQWFSSLLMLNAPHHSDHHAHPARPFPALGLPEEGPMLPHSLPVMASIALIPPLWRRVMDPQVAKQGRAKGAPLPTTPM
ncbi:alkane 1-monooxygenase [Alphaproteobacteria bacterium KMM 3653]|uniref:Alkane 1-monooxygenase n=1 Tax=Harenicola maris TaxID=2841044 RepID=A0AAP2G8Z8_9RHOB|nr:alkane 1-monooxygenase [Harenicola maris]